MKAVPKRGRSDRHKFSGPECFTYVFVSLGNITVDCTHQTSQAKFKSLCNWQSILPI